jgi:membrane-bound serine protease (ClpP class)
MEKRHLPLVGFFLLIICSSVVASADQGTDEFTYVIEVDGDIYEGAAAHIDDAIDRAEDDNAPLIIKLNTPGGLVSSTRDIVDRILNSEITVVVWVTPRGAWAFSAGTYILMASDVAVMDTGTTIGAAEPRPSENKTVEAMRGWMEEIAETQGRPPEVASEFVTRNRTMGPEDALEENVIDLIATNTQDILEYIGASGVTREIGEGLVSKLLNILSNPQVIIILLIAGMLGLIAEITTPGVGVPGVAGAICLLLALWGLNVIEVGLLGLALLVLGALLLGVEFFVPGFGVFGVGGVVSLLLGLLIIGEEPWVEVAGKIIMGVAMGLVVLFAAFVFLARRALKKPVKTGMEDMIGETGVVTRDIDPVGVVGIRGELWEATSAERIEKGEEIVVEDVTMEECRTRLVVRKSQKG